jgi:hypothetical protein
VTGFPIESVTVMGNDVGPAVGLYETLISHNEVRGLALHLDGSAGETPFYGPTQQVRGLGDERVVLTNHRLGDAWAVEIRGSVAKRRDPRVLLAEAGVELPDWAMHVWMKKAGLTSARPCVVYASEDVAPTAVLEFAMALSDALYGAAATCRAALVEHPYIDGKPPW